MGRRIHRGRNDSGSLLAATFVVTLGAGSIVFAIIALSPKDALLPIVSIVGGMLLLMAPIIMLRFGKGSRLGLGFWNLRFRNQRGDTAGQDYTPRIRKNNQARTGTNKPISATEARDLQENSANTWVPARGKRE